MFAPSPVTYENHVPASAPAVRASPWHRAPHVHLTPRSRSVRILVTQGGCGKLRRILVRRTPDQVTITTLYSVLFAGAPYAIADCPPLRQQSRTVRLGGRLRHRPIADGATGRVRYRAP